MRRILLPLLLFASTALAHEFWLQPASFRVAVGQAVPLRLLVGEDFTGETWPRPTHRTRRFVRLGAADSTDLRPALLADSVAPLLRCPAAGTHLVALTSQPSFIELPPDKFTAYLREEGLDLALRQREAAGQTTTRPGREAYRRCAKSLVFATGPAAPAPAADTAFRRVLGLALELVPEQNPYRLQPGAALTVRVLRLGQPVAGALVQVWRRDAVASASARPASPAPAHLVLRTNAQGRALVRLPGPGPYLVATVQMEAAPPALAARADWLSTWASLTFGGPPNSLKGR